MGDEASWDDTVRQWTIDTGFVSAAALCDSYGSVYAAAHIDGPDYAYGATYLADHVQEIMQEDGTTKPTTINEASTILAALEGSAPQGVWIGGEKYKLVLPEKQFEYKDYNFDCAFCAKLKAGVQLVRTPGGQIVMCMYDEERDMAKGNNKTTALAFAEYLAQCGF